MNSVIGALRVVLGIDTAAFDRGLNDAQRELAAVAKRMNAIGKGMSDLGRDMSLSLTAPFAAFAGTSLKVAGDFEAAMVAVRISTQASAAEMEKLTAVARKIGKDTVFSATEAAGAIDNLAKAGLSAEQILGGAAKATADLAAASGAELEPAANAVSDAMAQFKLSTKELPRVVDGITGAVNESKLSFEDFVAGAGAAGGVAGSLGVSFEDFNAVLAATSPLFASGSDAGTSFKTFLTTLVPKSDEAAAAMRKYGLAFFEADGSMKSMAQIAEILRQKLGGLSEAARTDVLTTIFGTDAMRTAIGLMDQGAAGLDKVAAKIRETDAAAQSAERMKGFNAQMKELGGAFTDLAIAIGDSGLLKFAADMVKGLGELLEKIAALNPELLKWGFILGGLVAAIGPVLVGLGSLAQTFATLSIAMSLSPALATFAVGLGAVLGPIALVTAGVAALVIGLKLYYDQALGQVTVSKEMKRTTDAVSTAVLAYEDAAKKAAIATGKEKDKALELVKARRLEAQETIRVARAKLAAARATGIEAQARADAAFNAPARLNTQTGEYEYQDNAVTHFERKAKQAKADAKAAEASIKEGEAALTRIEQSLAAPLPTTTDLGGGTPGGTGGGESGAKPEKGGGAGRSGPTLEDLRLQAELDVARMRGDEATALRLEDQIDLKRRIEAYEDAGLKTAAARGAAERDLTALQAARGEVQAAEVARIGAAADLESARLAQDYDRQRALERRAELAGQVEQYERAGLSRDEARARAQADQARVEAGREAALRRMLADSQAALELQVAQVDGDVRLEALLQRQADLKALTLRYQQEGLSLERATAQALADQLRLDEARARARERSLETAAAERRLKLAELSGVSDERLKPLERDVEVRRRADELRGRDDRLTEEQAIAKATIELDEEERARLQGAFRATFRDGVRAALDGDLSGFVENWWKDRAAKGLEDALNSIADLLLNLFRQAGEAAGQGGAGGQGGGGWLSSLVRVGAAIFTGGKSEAGATAAATFEAGDTGIPGFKTGGSFTVGGSGGQDSQLIKFWATPGEMVDVRRPGDAAEPPLGPGGAVLAQLARGLGSLAPALESLTRVMADTLPIAPTPMAAAPIIVPPSIDLDARLAQLTPLRREAVDIRRPGQDRGAEKTIILHAEGAVLAEGLLSEIEAAEGRAAMKGATLGAVGGATLSQRRAAQNARRRLAY
jgi:TP901 family phage tail tape measure protein